MTETKFTPGPWFNKKIFVHSFFFEEQKVSFGFSSRTDEEIKANTNLIISAPEMYEALQACHEAMAYMSEYDIPITLPEQVENALKKARGEQQ